MDRGFGIQPFLPGLRPGRGGFVERIGDNGGWPDALSWAIFAILLALLLVAIAALALSAYYRSQPVTVGPQPVAGSLAVLDARYARGEVDRETYLQTRADLSGGDAPTAVMPAPRAEPPPEPQS